MKSATILLVLLQSPFCWGLPMPQFDLTAMADLALGRSLAHINSQLVGAHLLRVTRGSVQRIIPVATNSYDLMLKFGVRETTCLKSSGVDPNACEFRQGFFVHSATCASRVRLSGEQTELVSIRCSGAGQSSSSSESSSEEIFLRIKPSNGQTQYRNGALSVFTPTPVPEVPTFREEKYRHQHTEGLTNFLE